MALSPSLTSMTEEELWALGDKSALELFATLKAVPMRELSGEYRGFLLRQDDDQARARNDRFMARWKGKAYRPHDDSEGEGYNWWDDDGRIVRHTQFATEAVSSSYFDRAPAFRMRYSAFQNDFARNDIVDEIRKVRDGLYLGTASATDGDGGRRPLEMRVFGLSGPVRSWVGPDDPAVEVRSAEHASASRRD